MYGENNIGTLSCSTYDILENDQFKDALKSYDWSLKPTTNPNGSWFYNSSNNAALIITQKNGLVEISAKNLMNAQDEVLPPGSRQISGKNEALSFAIWLLVQYHDFDIFGQANSFEELDF